jgi:hypothetical protein
MFVRRIFLPAALLWFPTGCAGDKVGDDTGADSAGADTAPLDSADSSRLDSAESGDSGDTAEV